MGLVKRVVPLLRVRAGHLGLRKRLVQMRGRIPLDVRRDPGTHVVFDDCVELPIYFEIWL